MKTGETWTGLDGTAYLVVAPRDVGTRLRWWVERWQLAEYELAAVSGFRGKSSPGPSDPSDLHEYPLCTDLDCQAGDFEIVAALVFSADARAVQGDTK